MEEAEEGAMREGGVDSVGAGSACVNRALRVVAISQHLLHDLMLSLNLFSLTCCNTLCI